MFPLRAERSAGYYNVRQKKDNRGARNEIKLLGGYEVREGIRGQEREGTGDMSGGDL